MENIRNRFCTKCGKKIRNADNHDFITFLISGKRVYAQLLDRDFYPKISYPKLKIIVISIFNGWLIRK